MGIAQFAKNDILMEKCGQICEENNFPFLLRYELHECIEQQPWDDLSQRGEQECEKYGAQILEILNGQIDQRCSSQMNAFDKVQLQRAKTTIEKQYRTNPGELIRTMARILRHERTLIASTEEKDSRFSEEDKVLQKYREKSQEILCHLNHLEKTIEDFEKSATDFHDAMTANVSIVNSINDRMVELQKVNPVTQATKDEFTRISTDKTNIAVNIVNQKSQLHKKIVEIKHHLVELLQRTKEVIALYKRQQKDNVCYLGKPPDGAVDTLNKLCEAVGKQLMAVVHLLEKIKGSIQLLNVEGDETNSGFEKLYDEMDHWLRLHLQESFVITKQPPNVMKIVRNKSPAMSLCVRVLGGTAYGLHFKPPKVTLRVFFEKDIEKALADKEPIQGVCKNVENGTDVMMEYKRATGHLQANLNNVEFRQVERLEKRVKDDRVTEYKYGVIFYTTFHIGSKSYPIKALSLPIILTSQTSQEGAAKGTLMWHAAFSPETSLPYNDPNEVLWEKLEKILLGMFRDTGRNLCKDQLDYIAKLIFGGTGGAEVDYSNHPISKERFMRDKVQGGRDFTYWKWLYASKNLIMDHVRSEWKDHLIYGFIGKTEAEKLLLDKPPGTFLLRFRERKVEDSQKANICAYLALAVVVELNQGEKRVEHVKNHLTPMEIHKHTLARILCSMVDADTKQPILKAVYPHRPFDEVVQQYLPNPGDTSVSGYKDTNWLIGVHLKPSTQAQSMCGPGSPDSASLCSGPQSVDPVSPVSLDNSMEDSMDRMSPSIGPNMLHDFNMMMSQQLNSLLTNTHGSSFMHQEGTNSPPQLSMLLPDELIQFQQLKESSQDPMLNTPPAIPLSVLKYNT